MTTLATRLQQEFCKLRSKNFIVKRRDREFEIILDGPVDTPFEGGRFIINIPDNYPFKSPSVGLGTKIFHPNIDENSGSVCLDVLNPVWTPLFDICNIVEAFLPQLLTYPNPNDPLNSEAASLYLHNMDKYKSTVRSYIEKYGYKKVVEDIVSSDEMESNDVDL